MNLDFKDFIYYHFSTLIFVYINYHIFDILIIIYLQFCFMCLVFGGEHMLYNNMHTIIVLFQM